MEKKQIIIEEVISQTFEVEKDATYEDIRQMYRDEKLVLDNPSVTQVNLMELDEESKETDWVDLHYPAINKQENTLTLSRAKELLLKMIESHGKNWLSGEWLDKSDTINYLFALDFTEEEMLELGFCDEADIDKANEENISNMENMEKVEYNLD